MLGILPGVSYTQGEVSFNPGDLLVLFSDGLVEATNESEVEFGEERLLQTLEKNAGSSVEQIKEQILKAVRVFSGGQVYHDDLTLLLAGRRVPPTT